MRKMLLRLLLMTMKGMQSMNVLLVACTSLSQSGCIIDKCYISQKHFDKARRNLHDSSCCMLRIWRATHHYRVVTEVYMVKESLQSLWTRLIVGS